MFLSDLEVSALIELAKRVNVNYNSWNKRVESDIETLNDGTIISSIKRICLICGKDIMFVSEEHGIKHLKDAGLLPFS